MLLEVLASPTILDRTQNRTVATVATLKHAAKHWNDDVATLAATLITAIVSDCGGCPSVHTEDPSVCDCSTRFRPGWLCDE